MVKTRTRSVAKSATVERDLETSLEKLATACKAGNVAVASLTRAAKQLTTTTRRLGRKRAALIKRKRLAAKRAKTSPSGETRRALRTMVKELTATRSQLEKTRAVKAANAAELAALKVAQRRANVYAKAIARADRALA
jgi:hypothetical protein